MIVLGSWFIYESRLHLLLVNQVKSNCHLETSLRLSPRDLLSYYPSQVDTTRLIGDKEYESASHIIEVQTSSYPIIITIILRITSTLLYLLVSCSYKITKPSSCLLRQYGRISHLHNLAGIHNHHPIKVHNHI